MTKNDDLNLNKIAVESVDKVVEYLSTTPVFNINHVVRWTGFTPRGAYNVVDRLLVLGIITPHGETKEYGQEWIFHKAEIQAEVDAKGGSADTVNIVSVEYEKTGESTKTDKLGMRRCRKEPMLNETVKNC